MQAQTITNAVAVSSVNASQTDSGHAECAPALMLKVKDGRGDMKLSLTSNSGKSLEAKPYLMGIGSYDPILKIVGEYDGTTLKLFTALQDSYNYYKQALFQNKLSPVVLTLNRKAGSMGYYKANAWLNELNEPVPEININPAILYLPPMEVMQTLVHEMGHHFQFLHGCPGRRGYHNQEFSRIMFSVGLMCSHTGKPGGKVTGSAMADYPVEGGLFLQKFNEMPKEYLLPFKPYEKELIRLTASSPIHTTRATIANKNKVKYSCPCCHANAWAKPAAKFICGTCLKPLVTIK